MNRKKCLGAVMAGIGVGVLAGMAILWFGVRQAPMKKGMLDKEPVWYRTVDDGIDYLTVTKSKYREANTPDQLVYELFAALNTRNWDRIKRLTVRLKEACEQGKITEEKYGEIILGLGEAAREAKGKLWFGHVIRHGDAWYVVMRCEVPRGGYWMDTIPLPLVRKGLLFYMDFGDFDCLRSPLQQELHDKKALAELN